MRRLLTEGFKGMNVNVPDFDLYRVSRFGEALDRASHVKLASQVLNKPQNSQAIHELLRKCRCPNVASNCEGASMIHHQCMTYPPSTLIVCPVTLCARFEARKTVICATSSGSCQRPKGTTWRTFSPAQSS